MKKLIYNSLILSLMLSLFHNMQAQNPYWKLEFRSSLRGEIATRNGVKQTFELGKQISAPTFEFLAGYSPCNHFEVELGVTAIENQSNLIFEPTKGTREILGQKTLYYAVQIPFNAKMYHHLCKGLNLYYKFGLNFQFPTKNLEERTFFNNDEIYTSDNKPITYQYTLSSEEKKFNLLFAFSLGFDYYFDFGLGFSLSGEYYYGSRTMNRFHFETSDSDGIIKEGDLYYRGDYWQVALGVAYKIAKKNDKN